ncbi:hypothetical protein ACM67F_09070 [Neisseria polysaccharea]
MPSEQASDGIFYGIRTGLPLFRTCPNFQTKPRRHADPRHNKIGDWIR